MLPYIWCLLVFIIKYQYFQFSSRNIIGFHFPVSFKLGATTDCPGPRKCKQDGVSHTWRPKSPGRAGHALRFLPRPLWKNRATPPSTQLQTCGAPKPAHEKRVACTSGTPLPPEATRSWAWSWPSTHWTLWHTCTKQLGVSLHHCHLQFWECSAWSWDSGLFVNFSNMEGISGYF